MILLPHAVRIYVATQPANLRKSFDGLSNAVRGVLQKDPLSGHLFVFLNRRKNHTKILLWTRGGFTILQKRLERGTFAFAKTLHQEQTVVQIEVHELALLLEGLEIKKVKKKKRWKPNIPPEETP